MVGVHVIMEDAVKSDVSKADFPMHQRELFEIRRAKQDSRMIRTDAHLPEQVPRAACRSSRIKIGGDVTFCADSGRPQHHACHNENERARLPEHEYLGPKTSSAARIVPLP
jgi:hypothetical protein